MHESRLLAFITAVYDRIVLAIVTLFVTVLVSLYSLFKKVRMSHENGIATRGRLRIVDSPEFPPHDFFEPGKVFGCRLRFATVSFRDDAKFADRGASLKFADARFRSPLDVLMNTGLVPLFWSARTFVEFMKVHSAGMGKQYVPYLRKHPLAIEGGAESERRNPESFAEMVYHTKTTEGFVGRDRIFRYARYRLLPVPYDPGKSGAADAADRAHPWLQNPYPDETRSRNYLKEELRSRLDGGRLHFRFQIQLRDKPVSSIEPAWVSSAIPWDEDRFPYRDVATVEIDEALPYKESKLTWFHLGNHPKTLPIPRARSIDDPHSINHLRLASIWPRRARLVSYLFGGIPRPIPDSRHSKDWLGIPPLENPPPPTKAS